MTKGPTSITHERARIQTHYTNSMIPPSSSSSSSSMEDTKKRTTEFIRRPHLQTTSQGDSPAFPQGPRVRPSASTNALTEFWQFGGRRILILYLVLAILLYMRSFRQTAVAAAAKHHQQRTPVCKEVYFIRHGEALHNRDAKLFADFYQGRHLSPVYHDAPLTETGVEQARRLRNFIADHYPFTPDLIVSSTLTRAIQTANGAYPEGPRMVATDLCRERIASYASDRRRAISELVREFPHVDFSHVADEIDVHFDTQKEIHPDPYDSEACKSRARRFVDWLLHERPEKKIVVVTHWVFLSHLLRAEDVPDKRVFENAEMRAIKLCRDGGGNSNE